MASARKTLLQKEIDSDFVNLSLLVDMASLETIKKFGLIVVKAVKRFARRQRKSDLLKRLTIHTVSENGRKKTNGIGGNGMKEVIQFLKELQQELKTQHVDCQATPRFWVVGDYGWVEANERNAEKYTVYLPSVGESYPIEDYIEIVKEYGEFSDEQLKELNECNNDYDEILKWVQIYEDEGAELFLEKKVHIKRDDTFFITKEEAQKHIKANSHHYTHEAHTYAMTAWRAPKVAKLWEILQEFDWDSVEIK